MSENKKSFFSSVPGLITGLAGLLTGIVGLVTVLIQLDVIGGDDNDAGPVAAGGSTTVPATGSPAPGGATTTISGRLTAEPATLKLQANEREKSVIVRNSASALVTVMKPETSGRDQAAFKVDDGCTNVSLQPGKSCTVKVQLTPSGVLKTYQANLVLEAKQIVQVTEVPIEATIVL